MKPGRLAQACYRVVRATAWAIATRTMSYPLVTFALVLLAVLGTGVPTLTWVAGLLGVTGISLLGSDSRSRLSSLAECVKFAYRRVWVWAYFRTTMLQAGLYKTVHIEDTGGLGSKPPGHRTTPKLYHCGRKRMRRLPMGVALTVDGTRAGYGHEAFEGETVNTLKARFKCRDVITGSHPRWPWLTYLQLIFGDPFDKIITRAMLPASNKAWHVVVGLDSMGRPVLKDLRLPHLIAGGKGAGKSTECWRILQALLELCIPFLVSVFDPKGGMEFIDLRGKAHRYEANPTAWPDFLRRCMNDLTERMVALKEAGYKKCPLNDPRFPLHVMIIDELLTVIAMMKGRKIRVGGQEVPAMEAFMVFLSQCRAAGFTVIACTQLTQKEAIGVIRDLFDYVTCLRVASPEMVRAVLGDSNLYPAHQIPADDEHSGIGFMVTEEGAIKYRTAWVDDPARTEVADGVEWWTRKLAEMANEVDAALLEAEQKIMQDAVGALVTEHEEEAAADVPAPRVVIAPEDIAAHYAQWQAEQEANKAKENGDAVATV